MELTDNWTCSIVKEHRYMTIPDFRGWKCKTQLIYHCAQQSDVITPNVSTLWYSHANTKELKMRAFNAVEDSKSSAKIGSVLSECTVCDTTHRKQWHIHRHAHQRRHKHELTPLYNNIPESLRIWHPEETLYLLHSTRSRMATWYATWNVS